MKKHSKLCFPILYFILIATCFVITGCSSENTSNPVSTASSIEPFSGKVEAFERDNNNYLFKLPKGYKIIKFEINHWLPTLGVNEKGPNPNYWEYYYLSESEIEERGIELKKKKIEIPESPEVYEDSSQVSSNERVMTLEKVVLLKVPEKYISWFSQSYNLELFDNIVMYYEKILAPNYKSFPPRF